MVKFIVSVVISVLLAGCNQESGMKEIDPLVQRITTSTSAEEERAASEALWNALSGRKVEVQIFVVQPNGELEDALTVKSPHEGKAFRVVLSQGRESKEFDWTPKDSNNVFVLFRED
nr:hypothetical protein [uncultured Caldimonas sp.]